MQNYQHQIDQDQQTQYNSMIEDTPIKQFQTKINDYLFRINYNSEQKSDISQFNQGILMYAENNIAGYSLGQLFTLENIPEKALTYFFDLVTIFDYIIENCSDPNRFKITEEGIIVSNIITTKGGEKRQEVFLPMIKTPLLLQPQNHEIKENPQILNQIKILKKMSNHLDEHFNIFKEQFEKLREENKQLMARLAAQKQLNLVRYQQQQEKSLACMKEVQQFAKITKSESRFFIDSINELKRQLSLSKQQNKELKDQMRQIRQTFKQYMGKESQKVMDKNIQSAKDILGKKIEVTIDQQNIYLHKYRIQGNLIEKVDGDETRFQIIGKEVMGKSALTYFQVQILNLVNSGLIIGVVSQERKGQRHSYDQKQCICFDGTGKIFEMGKKWPTFARFQNGQTIRVVMDLDHMMIRWLINYTQVGSVLIPDTLRSCHFVPYIELNEIKDRISLNK